MQVLPTSDQNHQEFQVIATTDTTDAAGSTFIIEWVCPSHCIHTRGLLSVLCHMIVV